MSSKNFAIFSYSILRTATVNTIFRCHHLSESVVMNSESRFLERQFKFHIVQKLFRNYHQNLRSASFRKHQQYLVGLSRAHETKF